MKFLSHNLEILEIICFSCLVILQISSIEVSIIPRILDILEIEVSIIPRILEMRAADGRLQLGLCFLGLD